MSADKVFRIRVETAADPSGAKEAGVVLNNLTRETEGAAAATGKHTVGLHAMHRIFHALNEVVPGLGVAMQMAFSPIGGAISMAVMVLRLFQEHIKKVNEEMDKMAEENAKPLTNQLEAMREATVRNAVGMAALDDRLAEAARGEESLASATERTVKAMREKVMEQEGLHEAQKTGELTILETLHQQGLISEELYAQQKLAIEQRYLEKKRELEERAEMTEILIRKRRLELTGAELPALKARAEAAEQRSVDASTRYGIAQQKSTLSDERRQATRKALEKFADKHPEETESFEDIGYKSSSAAALKALFKSGKYLTATELEYGVERFSKWQALTNDFLRAHRNWEAQPTAVAKAQAAKDSAASAAEHAAKKWEESQTNVIEGNRDLEDRRALAAEHHRANQELSRAEQAAGFLKSPRGQAETAESGRELAEGEDISRRLAHHQPGEAAVTGPEQQRLMDLAMNLGMPQGGGLQGAIAKLESIRTGKESSEKAVERLVAVMEDFVQATQGTGNILGRVSALERAAQDVLKSHPGN